MPESRWLLTLLFAGAALAAVIWSRRLELPRASLLLFLVMLVFLPGFQEQYCLWPIAPGSLYPSAGFFVYVALASGFVVRATLARAATDSWLPGWYAPWWGALFWLLWEARALTHARPAALRPRTSDA